MNTLAMTVMRHASSAICGYKQLS